jgi:hypothetical protein
MKQKNSIIIVYGLLFILLAACTASSTVRVNMVGMNYGNTIDFSYETFTGYEVNRLDVKAGETIDLTYEMVINKGSLQIQVIAPNDGPIWEKLLLDSEADSVELRAEESGEYILRIDADNAGGSMEAEWSVK